MMPSRHIDQDLSYDSALAKDSNWQAGFSEVVRRHRLWHHPLIEQCREATLSLDQVRVLAIQMYRFSYEFNAILSRVLAACPDEAARIVVGANLWEELGAGDPERSHPALFRRFTRALGITDAELDTAATLLETLDLIQTYSILPESHGFLAAIGAICYASEGIVSTLYRQLEYGITGTVPLPEEALEFFHLHIDIDGGHAARLSELLASRLRGFDDVKRVRSAIRIALNARCRFFDGVLYASHSPCLRLCSSVSR